MATTVRVEASLHQTLREIALAEDRTIGQVIEEAIARYQKAKFWEGLREDYERLRADPVAWQNYQDEVAVWDVTAGDGLQDEPPYYDSEEE